MFKFKIPITFSSAASDLNLVPLSLIKWLILQTTYYAFRNINFQNSKALSSNLKFKILSWTLVRTDAISYFVLRTFTLLFLKSRLPYFPSAFFLNCQPTELLHRTYRKKGNYTIIRRIAEMRNKISLLSFFMGQIRCCKK